MSLGERTLSQKPTGLRKPRNGIASEGARFDETPIMVQGFPAVSDKILLAPPLTGVLEAGRPALELCPGKIADFPRISVISSALAELEDTSRPILTQYPSQLGGDSCLQHENAVYLFQTIIDAVNSVSHTLASIETNQQILLERTLETEQGAEEKSSLINPILEPIDQSPGRARIVNINKTPPQTHDSPGRRSLKSNNSHPSSNLRTPHPPPLSKFHPTREAPTPNPRAVDNPPHDNERSLKRRAYTHPSPRPQSQRSTAQTPLGFTSPPRPTRKKSEPNLRLNTFSSSSPSTSRPAPTIPPVPPLPRALWKPLPPPGGGPLISPSTLPGIAEMGRGSLRGTRPSSSSTPRGAVLQTWRAAENAAGNRKGEMEMRAPPPLMPPPPTTTTTTRWRKLRFPGILRREWLMLKERQLFT